MKTDMIDTQINDILDELGISEIDLNQLGITHSDLMDVYAQDSQYTNMFYQALYTRNFLTKVFYRVLLKFDGQKKLIVASGYPCVTDRDSKLIYIINTTYRHFMSCCKFLITATGLSYFFSIILPHSEFIVRSNAPVLSKANMLLECINHLASTFGHTSRYLFGPILLTAPIWCSLTMTYFSLKRYRQLQKHDESLHDQFSEAIADQSTDNENAQHLNRMQLVKRTLLQYLNRSIAPQYDYRLLAHHLCFNAGIITSDLHDSIHDAKIALLSKLQYLAEHGHYFYQRKHALDTLTRVADSYCYDKNLSTAHKELHRSWWLGKHYAYAILKSLQRSPTCHLIDKVYIGYLLFSLGYGSSRRTRIARYVLQSFNRIIFWLLGAQFLQQLISFFICPNSPDFSVFYTAQPAAYQLSITCYNEHLGMFNLIPSEPTGFISDMRFLRLFDLSKLYLYKLGLTNCLTSNKVIKFFSSIDTYNAIKPFGYSLTISNLLLTDMSILSTQDCNAVFNRLPNTITNLDLSYSNLGITNPGLIDRTISDTVLVALGQQLSQKRSITTLRLKSMYLASASIAAQRSFWSDISKMTQLITLDIRENDFFVAPESGMAIGQAFSHLSNLKNFSISFRSYSQRVSDFHIKNNQFFQNLCPFLSALVSLESLSIENTDLSDAALASLCIKQLRHIPNLQQISLPYNFLQTSALADLAELIIKPPHITRLDLFANEIGDEVYAMNSTRLVENFSTAFANNTGFSSLDLQSNRLTTLEKHIINTGLEKTRSNFLPSFTGINSLTAYFMQLDQLNPDKTSFDASSLQVTTAEPLKILFEILSGYKKLTTINFGSSGIGKYNAVMDTLFSVETLRHIAALQYLNLDNAMMTIDQLNKLGLTMGNLTSTHTINNFTTLNLDNNNFLPKLAQGVPQDTLDDFSDGLSQVSTLTKLSMRATNLDWNGISFFTTICRALAKLKLTSINFDYNHIGYSDTDSLMAFASALEQSCHYRSISLQGLFLGKHGPDAIIKIANALNNCQQLESLIITNSLMGGDTNQDAFNILLNTISRLPQIHYVNLASSFPITINTAGYSAAERLAKKVKQANISPSCLEDAVCSRTPKLNQLITSSSGSRLSTPVWSQMLLKIYQSVLDLFRSCQHSIQLLLSLSRSFKQYAENCSLTQDASEQCIRCPGETPLSQSLFGSQRQGISVSADCFGLTQPQIQVGTMICR